MALHEEPRIIIRESPFETDHYDVVWKRREKIGTNDYRSRQKTATVENKLKSYDDDKVNSDIGKLKDKAIDYSYIDEYCKVSVSTSPRDEDSKPRELKTNTEFGRPKESFDKFVRHHVGGGGPERALLATAQPFAGDTHSKCHRDQGRATCNRNADDRETTPPRECYYQEDITLTCCGHNVETLVDYCTCMFCVKGLLYHCMEDNSSSDNVLDNPCSCSPVNMGCVARWSMLGFLSVFLPCLICYPLAKGCTGVCKCYKEGESRRKTRQSRTVQNGERERLT